MLPPPGKCRFDGLHHGGKGFLFLQHTPGHLLPGSGQELAHRTTVSRLEQPRGVFDEVVQALDNNPRVPNLGQRTGRVADQVVLPPVNLVPQAVSDQA